ncbi:chemotaxis protein CheW [Microvirga sp. 2TAF3]|uniref:chemotaxis protein CheW n=1 Tax=Microvirga sp. 2TAF3 TaxID=3233014 RepID=UPI003F9CCD76
MAKSLRRKLREINRAGTISAEERARLILDDRTERLASRSGNRETATVAAVQVLICEAGRETYGLPIEAVAEVLPFRACLPIPDGPPALVGLFGRGGHLISVIDLGLALGIGPAAENGSQHLVLLRRDPMRIALRVARAHGVAAATPITTEESGGFRKESVIGYAEIRSGVVGQERILSLLDIDRLLSPFLSSLPVSGA